MSQALDPLVRHLFRLQRQVPQTKCGGLRQEPQWNSAPKKKIWGNFYNLANENVVLYFNSSQWVCVSLSLLINLGKDFIFKFQSYRLLDLMVVNTLGCNIVVGGLGWAVDQDILGLIPTRSFLVLPDTQIWWVESCISGLLPIGGV